jgi:hypothetical protein
MTTAIDTTMVYPPGAKLPFGIVPIPLIDGAWFIDNSTTEKLVTCHRSAEYYVGHKREYNRTKSALEFGKIVHKVLERRYADHGPYLDVTATKDMLSEATEGFTAWSPDDPEEFRNYDTAVSLINKYSSEYMMEDFQVYKFPDGRPAVELPFAIPFGEVHLSSPGVWVREEDGTVHYNALLELLPIVWKGKIDLIVLREQAMYGMDHKTTSIMGPGYFGEFELSSQVHGYSWAIRKLTGRLPSGFIINGLGVRKPTRTGKSLEFMRHLIPIFPGLVSEWEQDTIHILANYIDQCKSGYMPKMTKWCHGKYGACEYKPVCSLEDPSMRYMALYSNEYRNVTWDPLKE